MKRVYITPVFKKKDPLSKGNYRPVNVFPRVSKILGKLIQNQIIGYIKNLLSPYLCNYRRGFSTESVLLQLIEKWKKAINNKGFRGTVLMGLSKTFDTTNMTI